MTRLVALGDVFWQQPSGCGVFYADCMMQECSPHRQVRLEIGGHGNRYCGERVVVSACSIVLRIADW
ncbi:MAG: hypothetical protein CMM01_09290 [Rhodopirellula sp.]|nr:hypothetical protein [Rhodopirellula sp.]